ncbi:MAG: flagellar biosynthesis anti-sigma factor FlgM [Epulopiscium sp.]|nr:flagellar biosynthesis anti-sigma factor FlgM [Candidatus Epulonipiscium sp.]
MKITGVNKVLEAYNTTSTKKSERQKPVHKKDIFALSKEGKDFQTALNAISKTPDIREEKVQEIKQKIQSGIYNVGAKEVADKIVDNSFDIKI